MIDEFHVYAKKKLRRFSSKSPNVCSFYGLVEANHFNLHARKSLFIMSIVCLKDNEIIKSVLINRDNIFYQEVAERFNNEYGSPISVALKLALVFDILGKMLALLTGVTVENGVENILEF